MIARGAERRLPFAVAVLAAVLAVALTAAPAYAQTVTTTNTYTLRNGDTATLVRTYVAGALFSVSYREVTPSGLVAITRDISFYSNGLISHFAEVRTTSGGADQTTLIQNFYSTGVISDQYVKIVSAGQTIAEQFSSKATTGFYLTKGSRILRTLLNGSQAWGVTAKTYGAGGLAGGTRKQIP